MSSIQGMKGKVVLVTGSGKGLGRTIALAFAAHGCHVVVSGRHQEKLDAVADEIRRLGGEAFPRTCDVTQREHVESLEQEIRRRFGIAQILVNNAGIAPAESFLKMEDSLWEKVLRVNLTGTYYCCKVFLPEMIASGWGRIINIASTVSKVSYPNISAYATSKHAVLGLTRSLAVETAKANVTVNAVCPGYVDTDLTRENARMIAEKTGRSIQEILTFFSNTSPQKRLIAPDEVAYLAVMLASESAQGITGQAINVDGGAVMV